MKITIEFDNWDEMEAFRVSGKRTRGKVKEEETVEEVAQAIREAQPVQAVMAPAPQTAPQPQTFPGANGSTPPLHPLVTAILQRIDGALSTGQSADDVVRWFRQQIGPQAANATLDQLKQIFIPQMTEQQLKTLAPQLGLAT